MSDTQNAAGFSWSKPYIRHRERPLWNAVYVATLAELNEWLELEEGCDIQIAKDIAHRVIREAR